MGWLDRLIISGMPVVPKRLVGRVASRYIAGSQLEDALAVVISLNANGAMATIDLLGEETTEARHAEDAAQIYHRILDAAKAAGLDANISLKPTHMGLRIDSGLCYSLVEGILAHASSTGSFLRIDMEDRTCTDATFDLYYHLRKRYDNVGVVIQACLRRTERDVRQLIEHKANLRLCKGIYNEPRETAYKNRAIIIRNYAMLLEELLEGGCYVGIATHCEETVWHALRIIRKLELRPDRYEFQMLLGVEPELRKILIDAGHRMRVYVPFGEEWYAYSTRRLKENPNIARYVMRDFLGLPGQK
ncbi:MAG: proline dehydrogenase [Calditrichaeota bacterium]|nr:proline dehydrogenase [Calditrichota bacterium]